MLNRNKRSICVDLKSDRGREVFAALVRTSDVLVTNFAAGVPQRLGFGALRNREGSFLTKAIIGI